MFFAMAKLGDLKRKKWQSKSQNTKKQVLISCLAISGRACSFRGTQENINRKSPRCSKASRAIIVQSTSGDLGEEICKKQERSRENPSCSVTTTLAVEIPDDLVEEILHHLPVYYLLRLKLVSKKWKSLIESRYLAEKHTLLHQKKYGAKKIIVERSESGTFHVRYSANHSRESKDLLRLPGSCSGLVCVYDLVYVYLFNPMTGVFRTLPSPRGTKAALTCTQLSVGFGRDVVTGSYKVVVLFGSGYDNRVNSKVFDLSTSKWRGRYKSAGPVVSLSFTLISLETNPVFVSGSLFWLLSRHHTEILVMDLHSEKFRTVSLPNDIAVALGLIYMWKLKDRLCVSALTQCFDSDLWVLVQDEVTERWERTRLLPDSDTPPLTLYSACFSQSLVSPYQ
ncbi:unnamed protein product [Eruca vesicaria subsp. sativa]|uniref:F-box domain-containing protein n=1 Tax=Eruca vesicaria subsp. sativa TaxID=29727 RepID=A0ABC8J6H9_ERUVS|nr:unnamed protein product [Eruca vesicaria subsp. sativa]